MFPVLSAFRSITVEEFDSFVLVLKNHDWKFEYSDDQRVWKVGNTRHKAIMNMVSKHPVYKAAYILYSSFNAHNNDIESQSKLDSHIAGVRAVIQQSLTKQ